MKADKKNELSLKALEKHSEAYDSHNISIPERLHQFYISKEALGSDNKCLPEGMQIPGWDEESKFRLHMIAPMWDNMILAYDDAVVGPDGDWEYAYKYLPIFVGGTQSEFVIVVDLEDENCQVGMFEEASWSKNGGNYENGVFKLADNLNEFINSLVEMEEADVDMEINEENEKECFYTEDQFFELEEQ